MERHPTFSEKSVPLGSIWHYFLLFHDYNNGTNRNLWQQAPEVRGGAVNKNKECPICNLSQNRQHRYCQHCGYKFRNIWRDIFLSAVCLSVIFYLYFLFAPCKLPVKYSIGQIDSGLSLSKEDAKSAALEAEKRWEKAIGREIFQYDEQSKLKIDFVYSPAQKQINEINEEIKNLAVINVDAGDVSGQFDKLIKDMDEDLANYNAALNKYSDEVKYWRDRGGAPDPEYRALNDELKHLDQWRDKYEAKRIAVQKTQDLVTQKNKIQNKYADSASQKNADLAEGAFISGQSKKSWGQFNIQIFAFDGRSGLITLLAHEMGHEFTRFHAKKPESILYYLINTKQTGDLTAEDIGLFCRACNIKK